MQTMHIGEYTLCGNTGCFCHPLQRYHKSPCTKDVRLSFVDTFEMTTVLAGLQSPSQIDGGTQKSSSECGPRIQPFFISEWFSKEGAL